MEQYATHSLGATGASVVDLRLPRPRPRFVPARGITGPHAQTILGHLWPAGGDPLGPRRLGVETVPIDLGDGDFVVAQVRAGASGSVAYLVPGLQGSVSASYLRGCAQELITRGWAVVGLNGRGCGIGRGLARQPAHAGDTIALERLFAIGRARWPERRHVAVGFSLSGNTLLLALARCDTRLDAAIAVHPPVDLAHTAERLGTGSRRLYDLRYARTLRRAYASRARAGLVTRGMGLRLWSRVLDIDATWTAPAAGFASREEYYRACSSRDELGRIRTPTVILASTDDPIVDCGDIAGAPRADCVGLHLESSGGHMGYLARRPGSPRPLPWLPLDVAHYAEALLELPARVPAVGSPAAATRA